MSRKRPPQQRRVLTATQEHALLHKHRTGDFPPRCRWTTIRALIIAGMVMESQQRLVVTAQGRAYSANLAKVVSLNFSQFVAAQKHVK